MNPELKAKIQKEIRRRAIKRAGRLREKQQLQQMTQFTLDALEEVTGLKRPDLESIADAARLSFQTTHTGFFSIKDQILITAGICGLILILGLFVTMI